MKRLFCIFFFCGLMAASAPSFAAWTVIDLGTLNPAGYSEGIGISDDGAYVTGWTTLGDGTQAPFRFNDAYGNLQVDPGEMINLTDVGQPLEAYSTYNINANAVNSNGTVVGRTKTPVTEIDAAFRTVPLYIGQDGTILSGINEAGIAVGGGADKTAYVLENSTWIPLPSVAGKWTGAFDINDNNLICGMDDDGFGTRQGTVWEHDGSAWVKTILPQIAGNGEGEAWGLNDNGQVVGRNRPPGEKYAVIWEDSGSGWTITKLDNDGTQAQAYDINNAGVVVGSNASATVGYMWTPDGSGGYTRSNIADLVAGSGWSVGAGTGISDQGWIVGLGQFEGGLVHAILITDAVAIPEPSLTIMILGLLFGLTAFRRR